MTFLIITVKINVSKNESQENLKKFRRIVLRFEPKTKNCN